MRGVRNEVKNQINFSREKRRVFYTFEISDDGTNDPKLPKQVANENDYLCGRKIIVGSAVLENRMSTIDNL